jgi:hypothetical protein
MSATIAEILHRAFPDRGGWRVFGETITAGDGGLAPSLAEIEAARPAVEAQMSTEEAAAAARPLARKSLHEQWDALPAWIRGPYRPEFDSANALLDAGDDEGAAALIAYAAPKPGFSPEQAATFAQVQAGFAAAISVLPS